MCRNVRYREGAASAQALGPALQELGHRRGGRETLGVQLMRSLTGWGANLSGPLGKS